ncbi:BatD family protein [Sulfurospirillum arcachonense]|uniref:BatD family protein n=1 Tax=Sulfurospirillum arcachonense TaxID=57666 RepID=UPI00046AD923|nr:BatD family protein [Sulfurospirillum arcachonense]
MRLVGSLFFLFLLINNLFAAEAFVNKTSVVAGERVVLVLKANTSDVKFPDISDIGGYEITSTGTQERRAGINGKWTRSIEKHYTFLPLSSVDIPSFKIEVDGKEEITKPLHVEVKKADITNSPFLLEMKIKKSHVMQFEAVPLEVIFKRKETEEVKDLRFSPPKFANFWVKEGKKVQPTRENGFVVHKMNFFIFPQKAGDFKITPSRVDVGVLSPRRDMFNMLTNQLVWKSVISNEIPLHVDELKGTNLNGDFTISTSVDKNSIEQNKGINLTLKISGSGNFDDIEAYKLGIDGANIYADKPEVKSFAANQTIQGEFTQKFSISSMNDFTIPSLEIKYYDATTKKIVTKKTEPIQIHVDSTQVEKEVQIGAVKKEAPTIVRKQSDNTSIVVAFISGVLVTICIIILVYFFRKKEYVLPKFENDRELLKKMLQYRGKSQEIDKQILALEENLYSNGKNKIDKKVLKEFYVE